MSAYGTIERVAPAIRLTPRVYALAQSDVSLAVFPLQQREVPAELAEHLRSIMNAVIEEGRTYPQEQVLSAEAFSNYFLSHDLFLGLLLPAKASDAAIEPDGAVAVPHMKLSDAKGSSSWSQCVAGMYYIKPNYPGRSSHNCNAGFIVPPAHRGLKAGLALGRSYLYYAPRLGYRASVFNLVYAHNIASLRIWDRLGFQRAGLIPQAGRLKTSDGQREEYVDAVMYYRAFDTI